MSKQGSRMEINPTLTPPKVLLLRADGPPHEFEAIATQLNWFLDVIIAMTTTVIDTHLLMLAQKIQTQVELVVFTSKKSVDIVCQIPHLLPYLQKLKFICVGTATATQLCQYGISSHAIQVPEDYTAAGIVKKYEPLFAISRILYPRSEAANPYLKTIITRYNGTVIDIYKPTPIPIAIPSIQQYDYIVLTSGSIATHFFTHYSANPNLPPVVAVGIQTAKTIQNYTQNLVIPTDSRPNGIIHAILNTERKRTL